MLLLFLNKPLAHFLMVGVDSRNELGKICITVMAAVPSVNCFLIAMLVLLLLLLLLLLSVTSSLSKCWKLFTR